MKFLLVGLAVSFFMRLWMTQGVLMLGDDTLGYLASLRAVQSGAIFEGFEWRHALGGLYLWPFVSALGENFGSKIAAILASLFIGIPFFLIVRRIVQSEGIAIVAALAFTWLHVFGFVLGYGFLTLISLAMGLTSFWLLLKYVESEMLTNRGIRYAIGSLVIGSLLLFTNISAMLPFAAIMAAFGATLIRSHMTTDAAGIVTLIAFVALGFTVMSFAMFGLSLGDITFRAAPMIVILILTAFGAAAYARFFMEGIEGDFIFAAAIVLGLLSIIGSSSSQEISTAFGRLWLWRWIPVFLVLTHVVESLLWWMRDRWQVDMKYFTAALVGVVFVYYYYGTINNSMAIHSTLTTETDAQIRQLANKVEAGEQVYVEPESLGWHLRERTQAIPIGPTFWKPEGEFPETRFSLIKGAAR